MAWPSVKELFLRLHDHQDDGGGIWHEKYPNITIKLEDYVLNIFKHPVS